MEPWNFSFKSFGRVLDRNSVTVISDFHVFSFLFFFFTPFLSFDGVIILLKLNFYRKFFSPSQWKVQFSVKLYFRSTDNIVCSYFSNGINGDNDTQRVIFTNLNIIEKRRMMENTRKVFVQLTIRVPIYAWHWEAAFAQEEGSFLTIISAFKAIDTKNSVFMQVFQNAINCIACSASIFTIPC